MSRHAETLVYALAVLKREENRQYIQAVYLYGSCARCEQKYSSDVDLLIFVKGMPKRQRIQLKSEVIPEDYNLPSVDLKICEDGAELSRNFNENFRKDGRLLWKKD